MKQKKSSSNHSKTTELLIILIALLLVLVLWDTVFVYPIKIFVVLVHELSHAGITIASGGSVKEMEIGFNLGGKIISTGGSEIAIASAGYLGSLLWGLVIFTSAGNPKFGKYILFALPVFIAAILAESSPSITVVVLSLIVVIAFILFGLFLHNKIVSIFLKAIALSSSLYVLIDIKEDLFSDNFNSDAMILSQISGLNSVLIGIIWMLISLGLLSLVLRFIYFRKKN